MKNKIKVYFSTLFKSDIFRNTSVLISGTAFAQLIPILLQPLLRRYFSPEAFGAYAVYLSLVGMLIVIASFKYELAIILPKKAKQGANILFLTFIINFFFNILLLILILIFKNQIIFFFNFSQAYSFYIYIVPLGVFLFNLYQGINYWLIRNSNFGIISKNKIARRSFEGGTQLFTHYLKSPNGLVIGDLVGHVVNVLFGFRQSFKSGLKLSWISLNKIKYVAKKYVELPKFNVVPSFMSACSFLLPAIFINKYYSPVETSYFDLSKMVLSVPFALIATSISNVLLQRITEKWKNNESFIKELYPIFFIVLIIALFELVTILMYGDQLFRIIFGDNWAISGTISKILVWSYAYNFLIASFSSIYIATKHIKLLSLFQVVYFLSILSLALFNDYSYISFLRIFNFIIILSCTLSLILIISIIVRYEIKLKNLNNSNLIKNGGNEY